MVHVIIPLSKTGIALGSILVITQVMGDYFVVRQMSGGQSASIVSAASSRARSFVRSARPMAGRTRPRRAGRCVAHPTFRGRRLDGAASRSMKR